MQTNHQLLCVCVSIHQGSKLGAGVRFNHWCLHYQSETFHYPLRQTVALTQIETCLINSRPLASLPCRNDVVEALIPEHFLIELPQRTPRSFIITSNALSFISLAPVSMLCSFIASPIESAPVIPLSMYSFTTLVASRYCNTNQQHFDLYACWLKKMIWKLQIWHLVVFEGFTWVFPPHEIMHTFTRLGESKSTIRWADVSSRWDVKVEAK